jgi:hypothetical protein
MAQTTNPLTYNNLTGKLGCRNCRILDFFLIFFQEIGLAIGTAFVCEENSVALVVA